MAIESVPPHPKSRKYLTFVGKCGAFFRQFWLAQLNCSEVLIMEIELSKYDIHTCLPILNLIITSHSWGKHGAFFQSVLVSPA